MFSMCSELTPRAAIPLVGYHNLCSPVYICCFLLRFDEDLSLWKATHSEHKDFLATSNAEESSLLLGRQKWTIHNDSKSCSLAPTYTTVLKMTGCSTEEFTCDDGSCVPMADRCNKKRECDNDDDGDGDDDVEQVQWEEGL